MVVEPLKNSHLFSFEQIRWVEVLVQKQNRLDFFVIPFRPKEQFSEGRRSHALIIAHRFKQEKATPLAFEADFPHGSYVLREDVLLDM